MRVHALTLATLVVTTGCYATHGQDDVGPVDAFALDARGLDAPTTPIDTGPIDTGGPTPIDTGPFIFRDGGSPEDGGSCLCASTADCPPPPPSWNCLAPLCSDCVCFLRLEPERCGPGAACEPTGECFLLDSPDVSLPDAGMITRPDAFVPPIDAFFVPLDAFVTPPDAFVPLGRDAGRPPSSDALRFTRSQVMTVPDRPALSIGPELTLELWARLRSTGVLAIKGDPSIGSHLYLELRPSPDGSFRTFWVGWSAGGSRAIVEVDRPIGFDTWTHFALVQRGTPGGRVEIELFVDGERTSGPIDAGDTMSYLASFSTSPFVIGRTDMDVDEVRLWRVARRQPAIQGFMRMELAPGVSGLVAYWPLDGVGQVVLDRSLNGNDGFRGGSPAEDVGDPSWIADGAF